MTGPILIGQLAARAGVSPDTIRSYERLGVLPRAARTSGGYRRYSESAIVRIRLVQNALRFGFSLKEVARFLHARESGRPPCREVRASAGRILVELDRRIEELIAARQAMQDTLRDWDRCLDETPSNAPARLLEALDSRTMPPRSCGSHLKNAHR